MENKLANPGPLGLLGFGMSTILLNIHNAGFFPISAMLLSMGIFFGGFAQVIVGIMEFKKGNTFGMTAFLSYGFFWLILCAIWIFPDLGIVKGAKTEGAYMGWFLLIWGIYSFFMWIGTFNKSKTLKFVFMNVWILFFLLAIHNWTGSESIGIIAGYVGIICGSSAVYLAMAEILEETLGKRLLPF
ncbi:MAG: hypothetical protein EHM93_12415 [Bacteroidales bacterium]|nr:MAG: hypothetical protein EHM93_12415 [Bacteroidales bacterium]